MSTKKTMAKVIVVGGGASGLLSALFALKNGARVTLLEKNEKLGKKIYITGKGRCNVTNDCDNETLLKNVAQNARFLYSAFDFLSARDMMALLEKIGLPLKTERGNRVFPLSEKASDVTNVLKMELTKLGCEIRLNTAVQSLIIQDETVQGVQLQNGDQLLCDAVILATGGVSYPSTGSTGDGYTFAKECAHKIVDPTPSLISYITKEAWHTQLQGLALKNVVIKATKGKKVLYENMGEMLFTHYGISGPIVLEMSSHVNQKDLKDVAVSIDLKPALSNEQLSARLTKLFHEHGKKHLSSILTDLLPQRFAELFPAICALDGQKTLAQISKQERDTLIYFLKHLPVTLVNTRPINEAIITRGGVSVKDVSPKTMQSKQVKGLYFAGELLDVDAHTGGFNLQIAFSTGALAGYSAACAEKEI